MVKILVVDDIGANRKLLKKTLVAVNGYAVVEAESGEEAIVQFKNEKPDLILMDVNMPGMDGYESASKIKSMMGESYTPIIFVTALSARESLANAISSGGDDFISKPFDVEVLDSKINAHLRIRELSLQLNDKNNALTKVNQHLFHQHELIEHFFVNALKQSFLDEEVIKYHMSSISAFNGDIFLAERGPNGGIYILMGDFTGHGLTAAMGTLPTAMVFFKMAQKGGAVPEIARELNYQLNKLLPHGMFLTATLLEIDARSDVMTIWMGGMPESYWLGKNGELKGEIHSQHMPLGILDDAEFDSESSVYMVKNGDKIYLCSDGITEAQGKDGQMFGDSRLKEILTMEGDNRFAQVLGELDDFTGDTSQSDDITFVEVTCSDIPAPEQAVDNSVADSCALPWQLSISLSAKEMRERDPVAELSSMLSAMPCLLEHKGVLHVLLSEMYSNALDYSILGLESLKKVNEEQFCNYYEERTEQLRYLEDALIVIDLNFSTESEKTHLHIKITDSGKGYVDHVSNSSDEKLHGRGLEIIHSFCENVSFSNDGRTLEAVYLV